MIHLSLKADAKNLWLSSNPLVAKTQHQQCVDSLQIESDKVSETTYCSLGIAGGMLYNLSHNNSL